MRQDNRAVIQPVRLGRSVEDQWIIDEGLRPGDRVIVDGFQKFVAGDIVNPMAWTPSQSAQRSFGPQNAAVAAVKGPSTIR